MTTVSTDRPLRVAYVALNAYPAIDPEIPGAIGGIETRSWMLARALAALKDPSGTKPLCEVQFVVRHTRPLAKTLYENVKLVPIIDRLYRLRESVSSRVERRTGFPWLTLKSWHPHLLWQLPLLAGMRLWRSKPVDSKSAHPFLQKLDVDLFCTFGVQGNSASTIATAKSLGRPSVLFLGSDSDLDERYTADSQFINPYTDRGDLCWWLIQQADKILAQTPWQQQTLQARFQREAVLLENPIDVAAWDRESQTSPSETETAGLQKYVLWVGRAEAVHKRPQLCVELARLCPEVHFLLILNPRDDALEDQLHREAPANVRFVSHVPFPHMPRLFRNCVALVNTSSLEGFPNTFLQAALSEKPVGALAVGQEFLAETGNGLYANGHMERLAAFVREVWHHPEKWRERLKQAREKVVLRHDLTQQTTQLYQILCDIASKSG